MAVDSNDERAHTMNTITFTETLTVLHCTTCGMAYGITEAFVEEARRKRSTFYCPRGHGEWFPGKTDAELRRQAERDAANAREEARIAAAAAATAKRELAKAKKAAAAAERRAKAALCPVPGCKRSFVQLDRHLHAKHPEYVGLEHTHGGES